MMLSDLVKTMKFYIFVNDNTHFYLGVQRSANSAWCSFNKQIRWSPSTQPNRIAHNRAAHHRAAHNPESR